MDPNVEHTLVYLAIAETCSGCCEWDDKTARRVRGADLCGLTPEGIKRMLQEYVRRFGKGVVRQRREIREEYPREFFYAVVVPIIEFKHGLFIELILVDDDEELPSVRIVNAHEQPR